MRKGNFHSEETKRKMGGRIPWNKGKKGIYSEEQLKRMSESQKRRMSNPEERKRLSEVHKGIIAGMLGKHHTEESRRKMSESRMKALSNPKLRKIMSEAQKKRFEKETAWNKGKSPTEETKRKISIGSKGRPSWNKGKKTGKPAWNTGKKGLQVGWNKGKTGMFSEETIRKMRESQKKRFSTPEERKRMSEIHKGKNSWMKGKKHRPESLLKMSEMHKNFMSIPENRERSRKTILRLYESGGFPKQTNTKPERQIKEELLKRGYKEGIDFIHQYKFMNKFMCDFCFPEQKVIVEVYGDFWHANPKKYPEGSSLHPHQIKGKRIDKSKEAYITKVDNHTWTYIVLWENDIKKDVLKCVDRIEEVLKKKLNLTI